MLLDFLPEVEISSAWGKRFTNSQMSGFFDFSFCVTWLWSWQ